MTREAAILSPDLLNPHYPQYYRSEGTYPPSDDQSPVPVYFLAVRPGVRFLFPYRLRRGAEPATAAAGGSDASAAVEPGDAAVDKVHHWLEQALTTRGAGAKTAAGYGYFQGVRHHAAGEIPAWQERHPPRDAGRPKPQGQPGTGKPAPTRGPRSGKGRKVSTRRDPASQPPPPASEETPPARESSPQRPPVADSRGFAIGDQLVRSEPAPKKPKPLAKGDPIRVEVLEQTSQGYRLRVVETGQEDLYYDRPVRWEVGQRLKVRVVRLHPDGRVKEVRP